MKPTIASPMCTPRIISRAQLARLPVIFLSLHVLVTSSSCKSVSTAAPSHSSASSNEVSAKIAHQLEDILHKQVDAWNRGDVEGFMDYYWRSDQLTFVSGDKTIKGWRATLERYRKKYPTKDDMGRLDFSDLQIEVTAEETAQAMGRWRVQAKDKTLGGRFELTFHLLAGRWLIVHDHTTSDVN